jgi:pimeloyl-ACP methyl ester carboxylesterase
MRVVLVHGAFRGGWCWDHVVPLIQAAGHTPVAVTLPGMDVKDDGPATGAFSMRSWVDAVLAACEQDCRNVLVGHSMGGVPVTVAASQRRDLGFEDRLVLIDAPLIEDGQRTIDATSAQPVDANRIPPGHSFIDPTPVGSAHGFEPDSPLTMWVNERLVPTPVQPSLDRVSLPRPVDPHLVFCSETPAWYPSGITRARCDGNGTPYEVIEGYHDAPLLYPATVADIIIKHCKEE